MTERVQVPAYTDHWMRGDRYGEVVKVVPGRKSTRAALGDEAAGRERVAHVKLDKSGKVARFVYDDCTPV